MNLSKLFISVFKKNLLTIILLIFLIFLLIYSNSNIFAAKNGLALWAKHVIPSLFPFFVATELLNYTNVPYYFGKLFNKIMKPLFNVPGEASYAFIMGILSGYPVGAKIINTFLDENICTKNEAERMLAFTNNSSPLFIIGTVGISLFGDVKIGIILFITHILACLTVGLIFGFISKQRTSKIVYSNLKRSYTHPISNYETLINTVFNKIYSIFFKNNIYSNTQTDKSSHRNSPNSQYKISDLGTILSTSITNAISTILLIGGFIVLFSIIISIVNNLHIIEYINIVLNYLHIPTLYSSCIFTGLLELTNGVNLISEVHTKQMSFQIIIASFIIGFAGLSIFLQIFSIASVHNLSMKPYFFGKLLQGFFAAVYTFIILYGYNGFYFDLITI